MNRTTAIALLSLLTIALAGCDKRPQTTNAPTAGMPQEAFQFTVRTDLNLDADTVPILIDVDSVQGQYPVLYDLDCEGDGDYEHKGLTGSAECRYPIRSGNHRIAMRGEIPSLRLCKQTHKNSLAVVSVDSWGDIEWKSMRAFALNCSELESIPTDAPNLSHVTDMRRMFKNAAKFNQPMNHWDVSHVTNMSGLFSHAESFNQPLDHWDVSHVTNMSAMFIGASHFNQPLENWNVASVTDMQLMFADAVLFEQPLEKWDVSNVRDMTGMFQAAIGFNQPLNAWNVSNVTKMNRMFEDAKAFNQPLENWNVENVKEMTFMFSGALSFNQPLGKWNVSRVEDMCGMFIEARSFNQPLENWDVSHVWDMSSMFEEAASFNQPLENWDVSHVKDMSSMFEEAASFNQPLNKWNVSHVKDMSSMFASASAFNQPLDSWNVSQVRDMSDMFDEAESFNQPLEKWNVSSVNGMNRMFAGAIAFNQPLHKWNISRVQDMDRMFEDAESFNQYPSNWVVPVPDVDGYDAVEKMFAGTKVGKKAKSHKLKTRIAESFSDYYYYYDEEDDNDEMNDEEVSDDICDSRTIWICDSAEFYANSEEECNLIVHEKKVEYCSCVQEANNKGLDAAGCEKLKVTDISLSSREIKNKCEKNFCVKKCDADADNKIGDAEKSCFDECVHPCIVCTIACGYDELPEYLYDAEATDCDQCSGKFE